MTLSEKIITLRNKYNMSQGDLAEKLNVSRQSVSKWETGASIPDLDKLIAMSNLFHITLDELAKDEVELGMQLEDASAIATDKAAEETSSNDIRTKLQERGPQLIVGFLLIFVAFVLYILYLLGMVVGMYGTILSGYLAMCGLICIFSKKNAGRRILITTLAIIAVYILLIWLNTAVKIEIN